jgi:DNA-binding ferritin-like protein
VENLNQLLADTMTLRDLYKKHHWQLAGPTFYQLHLLFDKHYEQQNESVDAIAERIQLLGGVSVAMPHDVAERTLIPRPPKGREEAPVQISRLLHAHEIVLKEARTMARRAAEAGDDGTNDLIISDVIRHNELQSGSLPNTSSTCRSCRQCSVDDQTWSAPLRYSMKRSKKRSQQATLPRLPSQTEIRAVSADTYGG